MTEQEQLRSVLSLRTGWRFSKSDPEGAADVGYDDGDWKLVDVPHDWAISGPFDRENDLQRTKIIADGETTVSEHTGRTGGLPHVGVAWYRLRFDAPGAWAAKRIWVVFDGVMSHSQVFLNGQRLGAWPFGYASFAFDLTEHIKVGDENVLAVRVDNKPYASRWYPGAGIYRNVRLVVANEVHVAHWGTYVTTPEISDAAAVVVAETIVENTSSDPRGVCLETVVRDPEGNVAASATAEVASKEAASIVGRHTFRQSLEVRNPLRWDVTDPQLYMLVSTVMVDGVAVDRYETPFGIRALRFDADEGFFLNGRPLKLKGVCMHHDLGPLGAAVNRRALERQLEILQDMGCNAIRTSHNPPAPELLDLCDKMGFLVMDEAFDEWRMGKVDNGYHTLFDDWAEKDLRALIRRDRNHPSVVMWSIGNEIHEQGVPEGVEVARSLTAICRDEDPTRPVTAGFNNPEGAIAHGLVDVVDVPGWNYRPHEYVRFHREHPNWVMVGSETESCLSSRDEYYFPVEEERDRHRSTLQVTSYDVSAPPWGYSPDYEFAAQDACGFMLGQFTWTGFDYLGEPTPYKHEWPTRSSYFGIVDLCGFPKDRYYLYRSHWADAPTLHLLPHWTWPGREGEVTPVHCYTNYEAAELFLNGRSLGVRRKRSVTGAPSRTFSGETPAMETIFGRYRLIWEDVRYEPGVLKVVALDEEDNPVDEAVVRTAGAPSRVELSPDRTVIAADGRDLAFVTVRIVDEEGVVCPSADHHVHIEISEGGELVATGNGDPTSLTPFTSHIREVFNGLALAIVRAMPGHVGELRLRATAEGLSADEVAIASKT